MHTHTHTLTLTSHLANPDLTQENRPPAHTVCDTAAVLRLLLFVTPFFAAGPIRLNFQGMNSLTWTAAGSWALFSLPGQAPLPQWHCTDTRSPGSQQRNSYSRQAESSHARASGADTRGSDQPGRQESLPLSFSGRAGVAQHPPLSAAHRAPQQSQAFLAARSQPRLCQTCPNPQPALSGPLESLAEVWINNSVRIASAPAKRETQS